MINDFGWDLPPGVTESMCEPYDPVCGRCGCESSMHYQDVDEITDPCDRDVEGYDSEGIERDSNGEITHACDSLFNRGSKKVQCDCSGFTEESYEPDYERDDY